MLTESMPCPDPMQEHTEGKACMHRNYVSVIASYHPVIGCLDQATGCTLQGVPCQDSDSPSGCCHIHPDTICILDLQWHTAAVKTILAT